MVLIIPGSGPTDRDGNNAGGIKASTYRLLAESLASNGVASLRIDKRGMYGSRAAATDANAVTLGDYADDVRAWVAALKRHSGATCIWLLGHSEGGLVALAAAQGESDLCGVILLAAPGRPVGAALREQLRANPANGPILDNALSVLSRLEWGESISAGEIAPELRPLFRPEVQSFIMSVLRVDPAKQIAALRLPVLILQGLRDLQISREDAEALKRAHPTAKLVLLPDTNHVFKTVTSENRSANLATYFDPSLPLVPAVADAIANFVEQ